MNEATTDDDQSVDDCLKAADTSIRELMKMDHCLGTPRTTEVRSALRDLHTAVRIIAAQVHAHRLEMRSLSARLPEEDLG